MDLIVITTGNGGYQNCMWVFLFYKLLKNELGRTSLIYVYQSIILNSISIYMGNLLLATWGLTIHPIKNNLPFEFAESFRPI